MKYFKDNKGTVYAYDDEQIEIGLSDDKTPMTEAEVQLHINPPKSPEQLLAEAKAQKAKALANITVTTSTGKVFDGDETARNDMATAILLSSVTGQTTTPWKLADNSIEEVTLECLQQALLAALTEKGRIIGAIITETNNG